MKINMKIEDKDIKRVVPPLRFPEFRDAEGWRITALSEVLSYERPDNYIVSNTNYCQQGIPVLTANKSFILGYTKDDHGIYNSYPVIIFDDFTTDKKYVDFPFKVKSSAIKILKSKNGSNLRFVFEMMSLIRFEAKEHKRYYISSYQTLNICIPKQCEQTKIADCLSSLDDLISAITDKIETLKEYKKGLMQQLFPAEGKTTPALRFPEFQNAGEWKSVILNDILKIGNGKDYKHLETGNIPVYGSGGYLTLVNDHLYEGESVCIGRKGTIDKPIFLTGKFWTVDTLFYTYSFNYCLPKFIYQIFQQINWYKYNEASGVPSLSKTTIGNINILIPKDIAEQERIVDCFSSVDELISAETDKLDQLKVHKKGLMQQLFPTLNK